MHRDVVVVRTFPTEFEAQFAQADLEAEGIPSILLRDDMGGMAPALQFVHGVRLAVRAEDARAAIQVLETRGEGGARPEEGEEGDYTGEWGWETKE
jgi:hypothetical protein